MPPATPVILHHGLLLPGRVRVAGVTIGSFVGIDRLIARRGYVPVLTQVHPTASIARRAAQLKQLILARLPGAGTSGGGVSDASGGAGRVVIFAHSMGGLDARHMITHLGMADRVAALVTVATPHRGSPYADWCLRHLSRFGAMRVFRALGLDVGAAHDLTGDCCARFDDDTPDAPNVRYYSVSAARPLWEVSPLLYQPYRVIHPVEGDNDGLVSVRSAAWGEHLGTWRADHLHVINRKITLEWRHATGSILPYYDAVLDRLESAGVLSPGRALP